ncbi:MBL fold metallo-hydrolase [bacterium]|nr:MBL fold metallo-hydrolase [bacterium]
MSLQFLGGTHTITGSKFLLSNCSEQWLIDCGLFQGLKNYRKRNWTSLPVSPSDLSAIILTHAHIDHSGYIPVMVKRGFAGKVMASAATIELCKILLPDSGYLQEEDAKFANKKGFSKHKPAMPLYTYQDAIDSLPSLSELPDHKPIELCNGTTVELYKAGHILGSRFVKITTNKPKRISIMFVGDIGRYDSLITKDPEVVDGVDYLLLECTYGEHLHPKEDVFDHFADIINSTCERGGKVLIPAFAVGRTQEILFIIKKLFEEGSIPAHLPIYLNSPLGINATDIYTKFTEEETKSFHDFINKDSFMCPNLHLVQDEEESKKLNVLVEPAVIIAGSGMMTGGRILHHLKSYGSDKKSSLIIVGFQAEGTRGRAILDGAKSVKIHGLPVAIMCHREFVESLSAHGDYADIMRWLKTFKRPPKKVFLVHGEDAGLNAMKTRIEDELHWHVEIPDYLSKHELV